MLFGTVLPLHLGALVAAVVLWGSKVPRWQHVVLVASGVSLEHAPQVGWQKFVSFVWVHVLVQVHVFV
jgi:hypothetical protein